MAGCVPGFKHDVFISYAHDNDYAVSEREQGWVTKFQAALKQALLGTILNPQIWMDRTDVRGNDLFNQSIVNDLKESATLIYVCSPKYLQKEWCRKELESFPSWEHEARLKEKHRSRIFKIELLPVEEKDRLQPMRAAIGYRFYTETKPGAPMPLARPAEYDHLNPYWQRIYEVASDLEKLLGEMREIATEAEAFAGRSSDDQLVEEKGLVVGDDSKQSPVKETTVKLSPDPLKKTKPSVYLAYLQEDEEQAKEIERHFNQVELRVGFVGFGEGVNAEKMHLSHLRKCDGVVLCYGADPAWVIEKVYEVSEIADARTPEKPVRGLCIYDGPPPKKEELGLNYEEWTMVNCRDGFDPGKLTEFIKAVKGGKGSVR